MGNYSEDHKNEQREEKENDNILHYGKIFSSVRLCKIKRYLSF